MHKYIKIIEAFFQQGLKYISGQKKKLYKNHKSSLFLNIIRLAVCAFLVIMAIYAGINFAVYAVALCSLSLLIYFIVPTDFLEEKIIKTSAPKKAPMAKALPAKKAPAKKKPSAKKK